jgi:hypothetical protein
MLGHKAKHLVFALVALAAVSCKTATEGLHGCLGGPGTCSSTNITTESQSSSLNNTTTTQFSCSATAFPTVVTPGQFFRVQIDTYGGTGNKTIPGYITSFSSSTSLQGQYNADKAGTLQTRNVAVYDAAGSVAKCDFAVQVIDSTNVNGFSCEMRVSPDTVNAAEQTTLSFRAINPPGAVNFSKLQANSNWMIDPSNIRMSSSTEGSAQVTYSFNGTKIASVEASSGGSRVMCRAIFTVGSSQTSPITSPLSGCNVNTAPLGFAGDGSQPSMAGTVTRVRAVPTGGTAPFTLSFNGATSTVSRVIGNSAEGPSASPQLLVRFARPGSSVVKVQLKDALGATATCSTYHVISANDSVALAAGEDEVGTTGPQIQIVRGSEKTITDQFSAFEASFLGGVRIAMGDFDGDGVSDTLAATGPSGGQRLRVFQGNGGAFYQGKPTPKILVDTTAQNGSYNDDFAVGAGDIDRDGHADIVTGLGCSSTQPAIKVISGTDTTAVLANFQLPLFQGLVAGVGGIAVGDLDSDGYLDIVVSACKTSTIAVYSGKSIVDHYNAGSPQSIPSVITSFVSTSGYHGALPVAVGDVNGDGSPDIIVGAGDNLANAASTPPLKVFSSTYGVKFMSFVTLIGQRGLFSVGAADMNGDGYADIIVGGSTAGSTPFVEFHDSYSALTLGTSKGLSTIGAFAGFLGSLFIGAGGG